LLAALLAAFLTGWWSGSRITRQVPDFPGEGSQAEPERQAHGTRLVRERDARQEALKKQNVSRAPDTDTAQQGVPFLPVIEAERGAEGTEGMDVSMTQLAAFDRAMEHEFSRLEQREQRSGRSEELARLKHALEDLDALWIKADQATDADERLRIGGEIQHLMGRIIGISRTDRDVQLQNLARQIGYTEDEALRAFVDAVDQVVRETDVDWGALFNRSPFPAGGVPPSTAPVPPSDAERIRIDP
jgi:hypothetical protein